MAESMGDMRTSVGKVTGGVVVFIKSQTQLADMHGEGPRERGRHCHFKAKKVPTAIAKLPPPLFRAARPRDFFERPLLFRVADYCY